MFVSCTQERAAKFDEKGRPPLKRGLSAKSHSLFEAEDKAAEEMILTARKHLFLANNLYSVSNHLREIIEKGEDSATAKVLHKKRESIMYFFANHLSQFLKIVLCDMFRTS